MSVGEGPASFTHFVGHCLCDLLVPNAFCRTNFTEQSYSEAIQRGSCYGNCPAQNLWSCIRHISFMFILIHIYIHGLPRWLSNTESDFNEGDLGSIPGLERFPLGGPSNPLQYFCLENSMDRRAWQATVHEVANRRDWSDWAHIHSCVFYILRCYLLGWAITWFD